MHDDEQAEHSQHKVLSQKHKQFETSPNICKKNISRYE